MGHLDFIYNLKSFAVQPYRIFKYRSLTGAFNYEKYKRIQTAGNHRKINSVWVKQENIQFLARYISGQVGRVTFGICHGTRRGLEQQWFREALGCDVIGTEISDTATEFPHTVQHDFHEERPEWVGKADFVYSNSLDHAYDPAKALRAWMASLKPGGLCIIEHASHNEKSTKLDPFAAPLWSMPFLVLDWSGGDFFVTEILDAPVGGGTRKERYRKFLMLRNRSDLAQRSGVADTAPAFA